MATALRKAFGLIDDERRRRFAMLGLFAVVVSGLEAISALFILVLMQLVLQPGELPELPVIGDTTDLLGSFGYESVVVAFAIGFGILYSLRSLAFLVQTYAVARVAENTGALLAGRLVAGYLSMPYSFHLQHNSAELIRNAYDNVGQVQAAVFTQVGTMTAELVMTIALLSVLIFASPTATAAVITLMAISLVVVMRVVQPKLKQLGQQRNRGARDAIQHLQQGLAGVRDVKILGREREFSQSFSRARTEMARPQYIRAALSYVPRMVIEAAFLGFILVVLIVAVLGDGAEDILATLGLFAYAGLRLQPSVQKIATAVNSLKFAEAAVDDLTNDLAMLAVPRPDTSVGVVPTLPFKRNIAFKAVGFAYNAETAALVDVDLTIQAGESIGISGHSGGGKTTFADLLCGLLSPTSGSMTVDGTNVKGKTRSWQRNIGAVHQTSFLIDDTLRGNIAFGVPAQDIDQSLIRESVRLAALDAVLEGLPEGLDTLVGERGVRLSGGQRQRVTLARAIYRRPKLLVLDEGTSALDNATEAQIIANLGELRGKTTLIMIAHRLSTIRNCDRIVFFERGRISAIGPYDELVRDSAGFRKLAIGITGRSDD